MTGAVASGGSPFDLRLFHGPAGEEGEGGARADIALRWRQLADGTDFARVVHARQLHGERITVHGATPEAPRPGLTLGPDGDGHLTDAPGILLTVATADCVPVSIVDPEQRVLGLLHAGWRGVVSGILEEGARSLSERFDVRMNRVHVHFGPSICGHCYEVGPEVFQGLGLPVPTRPSLLDLRATLFRRAVALGVARDRVTTSAFCTRCGGSPFFSHRGGDQGRQVAVLGLRSGP